MEVRLDRLEVRVRERSGDERRVCERVGAVRVRYWEKRTDNDRIRSKKLSAHADSPYGR